MPLALCPLLIPLRFRRVLVNECSEPSMLLGSTMGDGFTTKNRKNKMENFKRIRAMSATKEFRVL